MINHYALFSPGTCSEKKVVDGIDHATNETLRKTTCNMARQHQDVDRAVVDGNSDGNEGLFTVEDAAKPRTAEGG